MKSLQKHLFPLVALVTLLIQESWTSVEIWLSQSDEHFPQKFSLQINLTFRCSINIVYCFLVDRSDSRIKSKTISGRYPSKIFDYNQSWLKVLTDYYCDQVSILSAPFSNLVKCSLWNVFINCLLPSINYWSLGHIKLDRLQTAVRVSEPDDAINKISIS